MFTHHYHYFLPPKLSPTYYNLAQGLAKLNWRPTRFSWRADFGVSNFQFMQEAAETLEFKHLLAKLVQQYCPEVLPLTYGINDQNWQQLLNHLACQKPLIWILKPSLQNNGQNIKIFDSLSQIEQHFRSKQRLGGEQVLQQYVSKPHLLQGPKDGHKYSLRLFVVLSNYAGCYLYPQGYFNVALYPYKEDEFSDLRPHLTNEHLNEPDLNVVQIPSFQYPIFATFYPQIRLLIKQTLQGLKQAYPEAFICKKQKTLAIFGFDFMVDQAMKVWLLEANHGPCFPIQEEHPLQKVLYAGFWENFISSFVLPLAEKRVADIQFFERLL